jgi:hypothetical protein
MEDNCQTRNKPMSTVNWPRIAAMFSALNLLLQIALLIKLL